MESWYQFEVSGIMTKGTVRHHYGHIIVVGMTSALMLFNTLRPRQDDRHYPDDIFIKCIFLNKNVWISITISPKFVPKGPINNIPPLAQIMAWRRPGDKPLSEPMMVSLLTQICVTRPQWVNISIEINRHWWNCIIEHIMGLIRVVCATYFVYIAF